MVLESRSKSKAEWRQKKIISVIKSEDPVTAHPQDTTGYLNAFLFVPSYHVILDSHNALSNMPFYPDAFLFTAPRSRWYTINVEIQIAAVCTGDPTLTEVVYSSSVNKYTTPTSVSMLPVTLPVVGGDVTRRQGTFSQSAIMFVEAGAQIVIMYGLTNSLSAETFTAELIEAYVIIQDISDEYQ